MTNVLICDDSALMRRVLRKVIDADPYLNVVGAARDGADALTKARELRPDVITMDVNMPNVDGLTALEMIVREEIAPVVMVSSLTQKAAEVTFKALEMGAFDFVGKPSGTVSSNLGSVEKELKRKLKNAARMRTLKRLRRDRRPQDPPSSTRAPDIQRPTIQCTAGKPSAGYYAVAIGVSTGGPKTLFEVLPYLASDLPAAVFLVQHMPANFTLHFAKRIDDATPMRCVLAEAGMEVEPGTIYLAGGGRHMTLRKKLDGTVTIRTPSRPEHLFVPSVDVMMSSVVDTYGVDTIGVLMTGMGDDGADAMVEIVKAGGRTIAESEASAIVFGMPQEAIQRGGAHHILPSWEIPGAIRSLVCTTAEVSSAT